MSHPSTSLVEPLRALRQSASAVVAAAADAKDTAKTVVKVVGVIAAGVTVATKATRVAVALAPSATKSSHIVVVLGRVVGAATAMPSTSTMLCSVVGVAAAGVLVHRYRPELLSAVHAVVRGRRVSSTHLSKL